jgi:hypothetical protein
MARNHKRTKTRTESSSKREAREARERDDLIVDTAATFTCSFETAHDFACQCSRTIDELETDVVFNRLAYEIWSGHPERMPELTAALADCLAERERHLTQLHQLEERFNAIATTDVHNHLEPIEDYRKLVRERIFPDVTPPSDR